MEHRPRYWTLLSDHVPNTMVRSYNFLVGDPTREPWQLPDEIEQWLFDNIGDSARTLNELSDEEPWNAGYQEVNYKEDMPHWHCRFLVSFVFKTFEQKRKFDLMLAAKGIRIISTQSIREGGW
jgi:galactose-1-phosphate uridylyltransferase